MVNIVITLFEGLIPLIVTMAVLSIITNIIYRAFTKGY